MLIKLAQTLMQYFSNIFFPVNKMPRRKIAADLQFSVLQEELMCQVSIINCEFSCNGCGAENMPGEMLS